MNIKIVKTQKQIIDILKHAMYFCKPYGVLFLIDYKDGSKFHYGSGVMGGDFKVRNIKHIVYRKGDCFWIYNLKVDELQGYLEKEWGVSI